jgi:hypothetical protein
MSRPIWQDELSRTISSVTNGSSERIELANANAEAVKGTIDGRGPDSKTIDPDAGARVVFNISSVHIPLFVEESINGRSPAYKNGYDFRKYRIGEDQPGKLKPREIVDRALPLPAGTTARQVYFGAVELNGSGIRFYGDICLVLKRTEVDKETVILDRNSYDLIRAPLRRRIETTPKNLLAWETNRRNQALAMSGEWATDLKEMAAIKVLNEFGSRVRRLTTGLISDAVLQDEDYIEVLRLESFSASDLQEVRVSAAEAAYEAWVSQRRSVGPRPRIEALIWRMRRRRAEAALKRMRVEMKVVTTTGRVRS